MNSNAPEFNTKQRPRSTSPQTSNNKDFHIKTRSLTPPGFSSTDSTTATFESASMTPYSSSKSTGIHKLWDSIPNETYPVVTWQNLENAPPAGSTAQNLSDRSTQWLTKGDLLRLRTISLSYDLSNNISNWTNNIFKGLTIDVNLQNVATFSKFNAIDPETYVDEGSTSRNIGQGVINSVPYWQVFTASAGINLKF